ncbi:MAG: glycerate kinase [Pirellula sp.]|nr:glycerate kinase [Pirellula sp.]
MPDRSNDQLLHDACEIWQAGVAAVDSSRLVSEALTVVDDHLQVGEESFDLVKLGRIIVVGCGKAGAGMAAGVVEALGPELAEAKQLTGWINVPADCVRSLPYIHLHGARPAGRNEPTMEGIEGSEHILKLVSTAAPDDLVICLISGGGSALLPAPVDGVTLADKQAVTRFLSAAGANITELNTVRKALSRIKGGGLARACRSKRLIALIISDVLGDPLDVISSGPTVPTTTGPAEALEVLRRFDAGAHENLRPVVRVLENLIASPQPHAAVECEVTNLVIGNNAVAVDAAGVVAERLGYSHAMISATAPEGTAEDLGRHLADMAARMLNKEGPDCLISGGEPTVRLAEESIRGKGGRNQQLVLAAMQRCLELGIQDDVVILSGGTDGEDGPTDAAGAVADAKLMQLFADRPDDVAEALRRNDAYHFFQPYGALLQTGPTHTNVCDVRVLVVNRRT